MAERKPITPRQLIVALQELPDDAKDLPMYTHIDWDWVYGDLSIEDVGVDELRRAVVIDE